VLELGGNSSYSLYLSHPYTLNALALTWARWDVPPSAEAYVAAGMVACVLMGYAIHRVIEIPSIEFFRKVSAPGTPCDLGSAADGPWIAPPQPTPRCGHQSRGR